MVRKYDSYVSFSASSGEANGLALVLVVGVDLSQAALYLGLKPRRKSWKRDIVSIGFTVVPHIAQISSGLEEGCGAFAERFGWGGSELIFGWGWFELILLGRRGVREREEWISPLRFLGVFVGLDGKSSRSKS